MNSTIAINSVKNLQQTNIQTNEYATNIGLYLQEPQEDTFTPSFKGLRNTGSPNLIERGQSTLKKVGDIVQSKVKRMLILGTAVVMGAANTGCLKVDVESYVKVEFDNSQLNAIIAELSAIRAQNEAINQILLRIEALLIHNNEISAENQALLAQILYAVQQLYQSNNDNHDEIMALLNKMLDVVVQLNSGVQQISHNQSIAFQKLLDILMHMEGNQEVMINFMNSFLGMCDEFREILCTIVNNTNTISENQIAEMQQLMLIYQAILQGNVNLQDIYTLIEQFKNDNNMNAQAIIAAINGILQPILAQLQEINGGIANLNMSINDLKAFIQNMSNEIQAQMQVMVNNQAIMQDWLVAIWNKIPEALGGCNCEECCQQIIEILIRIIELLEEGDWNHEGIDEELGGLLGKNRDSLVKKWSEILDEIKNGSRDSVKLDNLRAEAEKLMAEAKELKENSKKPTEDNAISPEYQKFLDMLKAKSDTLNATYLEEKNPTFDQVFNDNN